VTLAEASAIRHVASPVDWTELTAITTGLLALGTFALAYFAWRGIVENKKLIDSTKREADLLWENAIPYLIPENVDGVPTTAIAMIGRLKISYAAGTIPARSVKAWVGANGEVRVGGNDLLTPTGNSVKVLALVNSRAGSEPPADWDEWLRRKQDGVSYRVLMRWTGPGDHITERAWWISQGQWVEVPESLR